MGHDPKLEVYKLKLFNKETGRPLSFRNLFRERLNYSHLVKPISATDIFKTFYADFIKQIDEKAYRLNHKKKKGFTLAFDENDGTRKSHVSTPFNEDWIITGLLEGGKYGVKRILGEIDNTQDKKPINSRNIIGDRFYFLIYTPIDHSEGILMIQGYTETKISDVVRDYLLDYFKVPKKIESLFEIYTPESFKQKYLTRATFKSMKFTSGWTVKSDFEETLPNEYELEVKIEIIDKSSKKTNYKFFSSLINVFGKSKFKLEGGSEKQLLNFEKKNAKMNSHGKDIPIDFDNDENINPVILLKDVGITIQEGEIPDFLQVDVYCRKLLTEITQETLPINGIEEL